MNNEELGIRKSSFLMWIKASNIPMLGTGIDHSAGKPKAAEPGRANPYTVPFRRNAFKVHVAVLRTGQCPVPTFAGDFTRVERMILIPGEVFWNELRFFIDISLFLGYSEHRN